MKEEKMLPETELEMQLHEQYAINNNSNMSSMIALFVGLFAAIGAYGYVFIHTKNFTNTSTMYDLPQLLFTAIGCFIVLAIMAYLCIYQGFAQRYEQFITFAIRNKHHSQYQQSFDDNASQQSKQIFPQKYNPFDKEGLSIMQGLYGEFLKIIIVIMTLLILATAYKIYSLKCDYCEEICCLIIAAIVCVSITTIILICFFCCKKDKYKDLVIEFSQYNPKKQNVKPQ